jgi:molybdopterin molybdotransferase
MISVIQAERLIRRAMKPAPTIRVPLAEAAGEVLCKPLRADRPLPPFDRVMMDGVALSFDAWQRGCREFRVEGVQAAGQPALRRREPVGCIEVMTGAVLPGGCDCIVPVEEMETRAGWVRVTGNVERGRYLHRAGSDARRGQVLVPAGKVLDGPALAVAASIGQTHLRVAKRPAVAIVSTGKELVDVGERPLPHQIRLSNAPALAASLRLRGFRNVTIHRTGDAPPARVLRAALKADIVLLTGGVSKGRFDVVPELLQRLGVREVFHRVRQRPGKPLWFGVATALRRRAGADAPTERGGYNKLVFGLPGNPVSCLVCLHRYLFAPEHVELAKSLKRGTLTVFQPVCAGKPVKMNTSGDFADLAKSDGFVEIPEGTGYVRRVRYWSWI